MKTKKTYYSWSKDLHGKKFQYSCTRDVINGKRSRIAWFKAGNCSARSLRQLKLELFKKGGK